MSPWDGLGESILQKRETIAVCLCFGLGLLWAREVWKRFSRSNFVCQSFTSRGDPRFENVICNVPWLSPGRSRGRDRDVVDEVSSTVDRQKATGSDPQKKSERMEPSVDPIWRKSEMARRSTRPVICISANWSLSKWDWRSLGRSRPSKQCCEALHWFRLPDHVCYMASIEVFYVCELLCLDGLLYVILAGGIPGFRIVLSCFTHTTVWQCDFCVSVVSLFFVLPYQYLSWYNAITSHLRGSLTLKMPYVKFANWAVS